jgi:hypothetical protein
LDQHHLSTKKKLNNLSKGKKVNYWTECSAKWVTHATNFTSATPPLVDHPTTVLQANTNSKPAEIG